MPRKGTPHYKTKNFYNEESEKYIVETDISYDTKLSCDNIFYIWKRYRENILDRILKKIESEEFFRVGLSKGDRCFHDSMKKFPDILQSHKCLGCEFLSRFIGDTIIENEEIEVKHGKRKGLKLKIKSCRSSDDNYRKIENNECTYFQRILSKYTSSVSKIITTIFATNNKNINYTLISLLMEQISKENEFPYNNTFQWAFHCGDKTTIIDFIPDLGRGNLKKLEKAYFLETKTVNNEEILLNKLKRDIVKGIFYQLLFTLDMFRKYNFVHASPSMDYLSFEHKVSQMKYSYEVGKHEKLKEVTCNITLYLSPSSKSSICYNSKKFSFKEKEKFILQTLPVEDFTVWYCKSSGNRENHKFGIPYLNEYLHNRVIGYKIGNKHQTFREAINSGCYIFRGSFDMICFLTSLLVEKIYYKTFKKTKLYDLYKNCFMRSQWKELLIDIEKLQNRGTSDFESIFRVLRFYYIRLDVIDYFLARI